MMPPPGMGITQALCNQCGTYHPPVAGKCPMAKEKTADGNAIDPDAFMRQMRTIVISQMQQKKIKDHKKFYTFLTIELTKLMGGYSE